jgi:hypothetical protein
MSFIKNQKIIKNFKVYDAFLSPLKPKDRNVLLALKMMYSIHMENNDLKNTFVFKQSLRFILKLIMIPFVKININGVKSSHTILAEGRIEENLSKKLDISLINMKKTVILNMDSIQIYKKIYQVILILNNDRTLKKRHVFSLLHRLIDYLLVYHTVDIKSIKVLLIENDRLPSNLALIHKLREENIKTVKYDNWLISPINHNDIYCKYYFYPSLYHRDIIKSFNTNKNLKYIEGGFLDWDRLYSYVSQPRKKIIYFTQFGIDISVHSEYILDIVNILKIQKLNYELIVKTHPRENIQSYQSILEIDKNIELIDSCEDVYFLISEANFCFSIFSTISLEAKHIIKNSYFINYQVDEFDILDYDKLDLDVVTDKNSLEDVLLSKHIATDKERFIEKNNCMFPNTVNKMKEFIAYD